MFAPGAARFVGAVGGALGLDLLDWAFGGPEVRLPSLVLAVTLAGLIVFFLVFFRDPDRAPGEGIVSAADGHVRAVERVEGLWRISVFMNVTDVHVNRLPLDAEVLAVENSGSGFRPAYRSEAERNVQRRYRFRTAIGPVDVVQITGVLARRLVSFVAPGAAGRKGDRFGMIVLGSRVDVYLPAERARPTITPGDRVVAGRTTIAEVTP